MKRVLFTVFAIAGIVTGVVLFANSTPSPVTAQATDDSLERPVIKNGELMELLFDPYYVDLRNALKTEPTGRREWRRAYIATFRLAEATNLLFSRDDEEYMTTEEWDALALESRTAAEKVGEAVRALDYESAKASYVQYIETCNTCHTRFEPDNATIVEAFINVNPQGETQSLL